MPIKSLTIKERQQILRFRRAIRHTILDTDLNMNLAQTWRTIIKFRFRDSSNPKAAPRVFEFSLIRIVTHASRAPVTAMRSRRYVVTTLYYPLAGGRADARRLAWDVRVILVGFVARRLLGKLEEALCREMK